MKLVPFIAENAEAALVQIHDQLGPDAVVVSVRKLPTHGISKLWNHKGQIEVVACVADPEPPKRKIHTVPPGEDAYVPFEDKTELDTTAGSPPPRRWQSVAWLETMGLLPAFGDELERRMASLHGENPPPMPIAEWSAVREALADFWKPARHPMEGTGRPHVFIGPPGSGKTTVLCKWLTQAVLTDEYSARVWRLDGETANVSEFLTLHCEMLNVPVERFWHNSPQPADLLFVDLPGVETHNSHIISTLRDQIATLPEPHVHLVLNAATETSILFEQFRAFEPFK